MVVYYNHLKSFHVSPDRGWIELRHHESGHFTVVHSLPQHPDIPHSPTGPMVKPDYDLLIFGKLYVHQNAAHTTTNKLSVIVKISGQKPKVEKAVTGMNWYIACY